MKSSYKNNEFKVSAPNWNNRFELPDESYSVSVIQNYLEQFIKKHRSVTNNPPIRIFVSRITFKIKTWHYLELLTTDMMKLLGITKNKTTKDEKDNNVPDLEITEVGLVYCNIVNYVYQRNSRVLKHTFLLDKSLGQFSDISPLIFLKIYKTFEVRLTGQNFKPLEIEDKVIPYKK